MTRWDSRSARVLAARAETRKLLCQLDQLMSPADGPKDVAWLLARPRSVIEPRRLGRRLVVKAPGDAWEAAAGDAIVELLPSRAFGVGSHPSTRLCCGALETVVAGGERVLDVGTGTGLLALAAARLGAARVLGIDTEPEAVAAARDNIMQNRLQGCVEAGTADIADVAEQFDVVVANLLGGVLRACRDALMRALEPVGRIIVAGFGTDEAAAIQAAFEEAGLSLQAASELEGWACLTLVKPPSA
jgi:ribosomal protein L11 methyltransferase